METTLATILITAAVTVVVIGLGYMIWAIEQLKRKVSRLEVLCQGYENEFGSLSLEHDRKLEEFKMDVRKNFEDVSRTFNKQNNHFERTVENLSRTDDEIHNRIDRNSDEMERLLDRRFDSVYRKIYNSKTSNEPVEGSSLY